MRMARTRGPRRRKKLYRLAMLNVKAHPHNQDTYARLLEAAAETGITVSYLGDRVARIGTVSYVTDDTMAGEIWLYTRIDPKQPILNLETKKRMRDEEIKRIDFNWVERAGFHYKRVIFGFSLKQHRFGYDASGPSPKTLRSILTQIFKIAIGESRKLKDVDRVAVEIEQSPDSLARIYELKLTKLVIRISRPNPDTPEDLQAQFEEALEAQNADSETTILEGVDVQPNEENKNKAKVATSNGQVEGTGTVPGVKGQVVRTTQDAPIKENHVFDPFTETTLEFVARKTKEMAQRIVRGLRSSERKDSGRGERG